MVRDWSSCLQILEGHTSSVSSPTSPRTDRSWRRAQKAGRYGYYSDYNSFQSPKELKLTGSNGLLAKPVQFSNSFDQLHFKVAQPVSSGSTPTPKVLIENYYAYTDLD